MRASCSQPQPRFGFLHPLSESFKTPPPTAPFLIHVFASVVENSLICKWVCFSFLFWSMQVVCGFVSFQMFLSNLVSGRSPKLFLNRTWKLPTKTNILIAFGFVSHKSLLGGGGPSVRGANRAGSRNVGGLWGRHGCAWPAFSFSLTPLQSLGTHPQVPT